MKKFVICLLILCYVEVRCVENGSKIYVPTYNTFPCNGSEEIKISYESNVSSDEKYQYSIFIDKPLTKNTKIIVALSSDSIVTLKDSSFARIYSTKRNTFEIRVFKLNNGIVLNVKGLVSKTVPQIKSLIINNKEHCRQPLLRYIDGVFWEYREESIDGKSKDTCGRRKVANTKFLQNVASTQPGDWPWHAAVYKHDNTEIKYICGGTLVSNNFVLTAAQCTSFEGTPFVPETLSVFLGKFNLVGGDEGSQQRVVNKIINHEHFEYQNLDNDIALLKLKTSVVFSDFVQPACLWYNSELHNNLPTGEALGTIVGWGFDITDSWSPHLKQIQIPMVSTNTCLKSNPSVYSTVLNSNKFCAGYGVRAGKTRGVQERANTNCNGDSGSAFQIFVPDNARERKESSGAWYIRGIVSLTVPRRDSPACDPQQYIVFTDVEKYSEWINLNMKI